MPSNPKHEYYKTLGVPREANSEEIRKSYRKLARKFHPDLNPGDKSAENRFKDVQEAYDVLSDDKKRQMYDQVGFYSDNGMPGASAGGGANPRTQQTPPNMDFSGFHFEDQDAEPQTTQDRSGSFRDMFSQFFRSGQNSEEQAEKGSDLEYAVNIDFWQSIKGTQAKIEVTRHEICAACHGTGQGAAGSVTCPQCSGTGQVTQMAGAMKFSLTCPRCKGTGRLRNACPACHGDGRIAHKETVEVRIPPGAQSGSRLRVAGKGNAGSMGAPAGDLYITTRVEPHPFFRREGDNIEIRVPVTVTEASLGAKIEVPTIDGKTLLKVPPGTSNGQKFRLRERGVFNSRSSARGDQIVEVSLQAPKAQDERTRELLRELATLHPEDPRAELWKEV